MNNSWWSVALSEEVTARKPLSVDIGDQPLVLWRDAGGIARALEDRCPHRRAPLSLGCVRENGRLQCGYHGWSYDGETGRLVEIPNMKDEQRFPPLYRARRFAVAESEGFVRVALESGAALPPSGESNMPIAGTSHVALDHARWIAAIYDDPGLVIAMRSVRFTTYLLSELHREGDRLVMERTCQWGPFSWPASFSSEFPISLLITSNPGTGEIDLTLRDLDLRPLLSVRMAVVPQARGVTAIRWRARADAQSRGVRAQLFRRGMPFRIRSAVDGARLRALKASVSTHYEQLIRSPADYETATADPRSDHA